MTRNLCFVCLLLALGSFAAMEGEGVRFSRISPELVKQRLERVASSNKERCARLNEMLVRAGCEVRTQAVKGAREPNVICTLPGESDAVVVVGAHFDAVKTGDGVADNWSGAAMLPTLYQSLASEPRRHTFVFVGFTAEEKGLIGSRYYVKSLSKEERKRVAAMVNLDTLGLSPTKVWLSRSDKDLAETLARIASALELPIAAVNADQVGNGDHQSFRSKKIPCLVVHSVTQETYPILHSARDNLSAIQFDDYYDTYRLLAVFLAYADVGLPAAEPAEAAPSGAVAEQQ